MECEEGMAVMHDIMSRRTPRFVQARVRVRIRIRARIRIMLGLGLGL